MLAGQIGVVTAPPGRVGRLVQWWTRSPASHTIYAVSEELCMSAQIPRVMLRKISEFNGVVWTNEEITLEGLARAAEFVSSQVGKPYAYWDIFLIGVSDVLKAATPGVIKRRVAKFRSWYCSELCLEAMRLSGVDLFPGRSTWTVTPHDIYLLLHSTETSTLPVILGEM
jgi:uncharacterized protein YycO